MPSSRAQDHASHPEQPADPRVSVMEWLLDLGQLAVQRLRPPVPPSRPKR